MFIRGGNKGNIMSGGHINVARYSDCGRSLCSPPIVFHNVRDMIIDVPFLRRQFAAFIPCQAYSVL